MCGIVAAASKSNMSLSILFDGLKHLEYRGYDSAGIAIHSKSGISSRYRKEGKVCRAYTSSLDR